MMEILQTIWTALTTENETIVKILFIPLSFVDALVNMLLFTTLLNIKCSRERKIIYVVVFASLSLLSRFIFDIRICSFSSGILRLAKAQSIFFCRLRLQRHSKIPLL